jgi:hypothetical protein
LIISDEEMANFKEVQKLVSSSNIKAFIILILYMISHINATGKHYYELKVVMIF